MVDRREFLKGSAVALAAGGAAACAPAPDAIESRGPAGDAGIDHIIVVCMENRSFDHFLGWLPGADGRQAGLSFVDRNGDRHATYHLDRFGTCGLGDPGHSYTAGRIQYNGGACDGFLLDAKDRLPIGYYEADDLPFWGTAAPAWTVCDRWFAATMGPTHPNRYYLHCGTTDRVSNTLRLQELQTIWDRLQWAGLQGRYYFSDVPFTALWGTKLLGISRPFDGFLEDCASGRLPHVSYVDPRFLVSAFGTSSDYHPPTDIRLGDEFLMQVYNAVVDSPAWERTVLVITFDEWGGFYDYVRPEVAPDSNPLTTLRGFRVPNVVISPYARRGYVDHQVYDHASVLKMIEWAWDLPSLTPRDEAANNLIDVLDLNNPPNTSAPRWSIPLFTSEDCAGNIVNSAFNPVMKLARSEGFAVD